LGKSSRWLLSWLETASSHSSFIPSIQRRAHARTVHSAHDVGRAGAARERRRDGRRRVAVQRLCEQPSRDREIWWGSFFSCWQPLRSRNQSSDTPGSDNPSRAYGRRRHMMTASMFLITAGMVRVTNRVTPASECNPTHGGRKQRPSSYAPSVRLGRQGCCLTPGGCHSISYMDPTGCHQLAPPPHVITKGCLSTPPGVSLDGLYGLHRLSSTGCECFGKTTTAK
jgi:hypothetical protein